MAKTTVKKRNRSRAKAEENRVWVNSLKEIRKSRGPKMTQARLAELISTPEHRVGQTTIAAIETGRISGRKYMFQIANVLGVPATEIFPYAAFISINEAAKAVGASTNLVYKKIHEGNLPMYRIKGTNFVKPEDVLGTKFRTRVGPSMRDRLHYFLLNDGPMTAEELTDLFRPFTSAAERKKTKNTVMVLLSRYDEFVKDESTYPAHWKYEESSLVNPKRKRKARTTKARKVTTARRNHRPKAPA